MNGIALFDVAAYSWMEAPNMGLRQMRASADVDFSLTADSKHINHNYEPTWVEVTSPTYYNVSGTNSEWPDVQVGPTTPSLSTVTLDGSVGEDPLSGVVRAFRMEC
eukprot:GABW01004711.1.p1 GENE.GABW01004711.1~~GABW01004711.1.p1  ORF type:complete len:106 (-),score=15.63 GABW01004711.1:122-439(-)